MAAAPSTSPTSRRRAEVFLVLCTVLWGSTFPAMKWLLGPADEGGGSMGPWGILATRFGIAAVMVALWRPASLRVRGHGREWARALWLGLLLAVGYVPQAVGLQSTSVSNSAFLTAMFVVGVPPLQWALLGRRPRAGALIGVPLAVVGLALMTGFPGAPFGPGDLWTLLCALGFAVYIVEIARLVPGADLPRLLLGQFGVLTALCLPVAIAQGDLPPIGDGSAVALLLHLGVLCTFVVVLLHTRFQPDTTPTRASLIFTLEPVVAALLGWATLGEAMGLMSLAGAALILAAVIVSELGGDRAPPSDQSSG